MNELFNKVDSVKFFDKQCNKIIESGILKESKYEDFIGYFKNKCMSICVLSDNEFEEFIEYYKFRINGIYNYKNK